VRVQLGEIDSSGAQGRPERDDTAGLDEPTRLSLCRRWIIAPPTYGNHVVWVAFERASLNRAIESVGRITFYQAEWVSQSLEHGSNLDQIPSELTNSGSIFSYKDLPGGPRTVLARVDLGNGAFTDAPRVAAEQAQGVVALASFHAGDRYWRHRKGYVHAIDGRVAGWSSFGETIDRRDVSSSFDYTANELPTIAATLGPRVPVAGRALTETIEALRWWQDSKDQNALAALVLDVRVLQLITSRVTNRPWHDFAKTHLAKAWVRSQVFNALQDVVWNAVEMFAYEEVDSSDHAILADLRYKVLSGEGRGRYTFHNDEALASLPALAAIFPVHDDLGRRIHTLADRLSSTQKLDAWCQELDSRWTLALNRLVRARNALEHGGPLTVGAAETVHRLARRLAGQALSLTLEGLFDGRGVETAHDDFRMETMAWRTGIAAVGSVHDALFRR
jgi:hypothetical protein